jgi:hypothetical protein
MLIAILLTFVLTSAAYSALGWLVARRLASHVRGNPDAARALVEHLFTPVFARAKGRPRDSPAPDAASSL